jgi:hypothetical protein
MARDPLLQSMLAALPEEERSRFLSEVFASLSPAAKSELLLQWRGIVAEPGDPTRLSPVAAENGGEREAAGRAPNVSFEHFSASMGAEFQRDRQIQWGRSVACAGMLVLATAVVFLLAWALREITAYFTALLGG